jgi:2-C-methyl-D-erythritol 4-phosphate cytidylyltransferase
MDDRAPIWGILLAAGRGSRFGRPKHNLELHDVPLWQWAQRALVDGGVGELVVVGDVDGAVPGGDRRRDSVAAGLAQIPVEDGLVLVHDAARPLLTPDVVQRVIARLLVGDVAGVIPAVPVRDTIKRVERERVVETVERLDLVAVQTPQGFDIRTLRAAHAASAVEATDDASMVESIGRSIAVVEGDPMNLKVTYPEDLLLIEALRSGHYE